MTIQKTIVTLIFLCLSGYVMANKIEKFEQLSINDIVDYQIEKMIHSLDLTEAQRIKIEAILQSSSNQIKKNKSELMKIRKQFMEMEHSDIDYKEKVQELSGEIGGLISDQLVLRGSIKRQIYDVLEDDQKVKIKNRDMRNNQHKTKRSARERMRQFFRKNN
tara:strand:+ start:434 stop:919 length:486 start_codon:yes stop_codon:yes gene_type:complete